MSADPPAPRTTLRILQTTDLHMHLLGYDYFGDRADTRLGLAQLAGLITQLRAEMADATLLFDNGDFLQGNPLADMLATHLPAVSPHPMIAAMNSLSYDALTLGNHEFDFGLPFLRNALADAKPAIVNANLIVRDGPPLAEPYRILDRDLMCDDGVRRPIRIGVTGFAPPNFVLHETHKDANQIDIADIVDAARRVVPAIRANGADLVVALCHAGLGGADHVQGMENAAIPLAAVDGIDVLLMGHTHGQFPDHAMAGTSAVDPVNGQIHGKPAMMAGLFGTSLGVMDLQLHKGPQGWRIERHATQLLKPDTQSLKFARARDQIEAIAQDAHARTLTQMRQPIARTRVPIHSYFATVQPDMSLQLVADAMRASVSANLICDVPVLAAVSPFRFGGRDGLGHYMDIPCGPITLRDAAAMFPFADGLYAVRRTGAQITSWLERAASHYHQLEPDRTFQPLLNPLSPGYNCDAIFGLTYEIDLRSPARFDPYGNLVAPGARRIGDLSFNNVAVKDDDIFIVATNSFRAKAGGGFPQIAKADILWRAQTKLRDILIQSLRTRQEITAKTTPVWRFRPIAGASAQFPAAPQAIAHLPEGITHNGTCADGLETFTLSL